MKYRMSEGMTNIGTPLKEAMERTPRPNTPLGLPLFWDAPAPRPDGSLINEGTKEPETSYATAWLSGHAQGLEDGMAMKREQKLLTDSDFADILEDEIEKQGGGGAGFNVDQLMRAVEKVCRERYTTPPQRTWIGLTDEEINEIWASQNKTGEQITRDIEAKLKEKNFEQQPNT